MLKEIVLCFIASIVVFFLVAFSMWYFVPCVVKDGETLSAAESIVNAYHTGVRGYVFSSFLSIGAFMFSLMTFVITNLKEKLFDTDKYIQDYAKNMSRAIGKKVNPEQVMKKNIYAPLMSLTTFICIAIFCSIFTSIFQFTIGFSDNIYSVMFCGYFSILTICFFIRSLCFLWKNIKNWLDTEETISIIKK